VNEYSILFTYTVFLMVVLLLITMGAPSLVDEETRQKLESLSVPKEKPSWIDIPVIGPIYGFFKAVYDGLTTLYILLSFSSTIRWFTLIILTPYLVLIFYIILRLLRGGG